jgi:glutamate synthase domain-containing protein 3
MSGGIAFVLDEDGTFASRCNTGMVALEPIADAEDEKLVFDLVSEHVERTQSVRGAALLGDFARVVKRFVKVIPTEYKKILETQQIEREREGIRRLRLVK